MNKSKTQVWQALKEANLVQGAAPEEKNLESPWYVKVLLGFSGWLAALFLLGFIGAAFAVIVESKAVSFITGCAMIAGAFYLLHAEKNEFVEHLALAVSLAGQALVVSAFSDLFQDYEILAWALVVVIEVLLAVIMPHFVHRVFSSVATAVAFYMFLFTVGAHYLFTGIVLFGGAWLWLNEFSSPAQISKFRAIAYGQILALIPIKGTLLFGYGSLGWSEYHKQAQLWLKPWMGEVLTAAVLLYVVWEILKRNGQPINGKIAIVTFIGTLFLAFVSIEAQGITIGIVIILIGFAGSNRVLLGLGIVSLLFYISSYYYLLDTTLLVKAQILLAVGVVLLLFRWILLRVLPVMKEIDNVR